MKWHRISPQTINNYRLYLKIIGNQITFYLVCFVIWYRFEIKDFNLICLTFQNTEFDVNTLVEVYIIYTWILNGYDRLEKQMPQITVDLFVRTLNVVNWLFCWWSIRILCKCSIQMLGIHWLCVGVYIQCAFRFAIETMKMHAIWVTRLDSNAAFNNQLKRWIKWHMRTDQTKWNKQNKTQKAPHLLWNCIKTLCSLPIAIDVYLCFISLRNIRIVKRKKIPTTI